MDKYTNPISEVETGSISGANGVCEYCGGPIKIRNPKGNCDHLYYPENVNKSLKGLTMNTQVKHTKTPWEVNKSGKSGTLISIHQCGRTFPLALTFTGDDTELQEANAAYIVKAVNNHKKLISALEEFDNQIPELWGDSVINGSITLQIEEGVIDRIKQALSAVKGE